MSMGTPEIPTQPQRLPEGAGETEEIEEIAVEITEDNLVWVHGADWELFLSPIEARELGEALRDAADDAEQPTE